MADPEVAGQEGIEVIPLLDEELQVALPSGHPMAARTRLRMRDLRDETWIEGSHPDCLGPIPNLTDALGCPPSIGFHCDHWNGKQALIAAGVGITVVPTLALAAIRPDVVVLPTTPVLPSRRLYVVAVDPPFRQPATVAMLEILTTMAHDLASTASASEAVTAS